MSNSACTSGTLLTDMQRCHISHVICLMPCVHGVPCLDVPPYLQIVACWQENASSALDAVLGEFSQLGQRTFHLVGNHCLYNLPRSHLNQQLGIDGPPCGGSYYSFCPHPLWRIVMLDSYDISSLGWDRCHPKAKMANTLLERLNPNKVPPEFGPPASTLLLF